MKLSKQEALEYLQGWCVIVDPKSELYHSMRAHVARLRKEGHKIIKVYNTYLNEWTYVYICKNSQDLDWFNPLPFILKVIFLWIVAFTIIWLTAFILLQILWK